MMGRPLIADPDLPNKLLNDDHEDIRPCLLCNQIRVGRLYENRKIGCAVSPEAVAKGEYHITKAEKPLNVAIIGGGISGCDMALELAMDGKDVTIVEMQSELCPTALLDNRNPLMFHLRDNHVKQLTSTKIKEIMDKGVVAENKDGDIKLDADLVIAAFGTHTNKEYVDAICEKYPTTLVIGDCVKVGQVAEAVRGGYFAAYSLR